MSEMEDRIAKAIDEASTYGDGPRWKAELPKLARAVIEAMREPTPEMLKATRDLIHEIGGEPDRMWHFMIDAALDTEPAPVD